MLTGLITLCYHAQSTTDLFPHLSILESKYILGYSDADLAVTLKCKPSSIRMKLFRAREKARKLIRSLGRDVEL